MSGFNVVVRPPAKPLSRRRSVSDSTSVSVSMASGWYEVDVDSREGGWREYILCRLLLSAAFISSEVLLAKGKDDDEGDEDKEREGEPSRDEGDEDRDEDSA